MHTNREQGIVENLLKWYELNQRDLPWRRSQEPYKIWISEIMAQQTRIQALLTYYNRFIELFPTVEALANANEDDVLKAWEGLGYYARAKNLQKAAKQIMSDFHGEIPNTEKELRSLSGIGEYTAGAILSIAFHQPVPAVDGNVLRVHSRLEDSDLDIMLPKTKQLVNEYIKELMPPENTSAFTQAFMELGALVCTPTSPKCLGCPLSQYCKAYSLGHEIELPIKSNKKKPTDINKTILMICCEDKILMKQRTEKLLNGLWEFLMLEEKLSQQEIVKELQKYGFILNKIQSLGDTKHVFSHLIWHMTGYMCYVENSVTIENYLYQNVREIEELAMPTALKFYKNKLMGM